MFIKRAWQMQNNAHRTLIDGSSSDVFYYFDNSDVSRQNFFGRTKASIRGFGNNKHELVI